MTFCPRCGGTFAEPKPLIGLTRVQERLLAFIVTRLEIDRVAPSVMEMAAGIGLKSKSGTHRAVVALQERGWITAPLHRARGIRLTPAAVTALARQRVPE